jgi:hypothetical protein
VEFLQGQMKRLTDMRQSTKGKFKVICIDKFDNVSFVCGEFDTAEEALSFAQDQTEEAMKYVNEPQSATVYCAYDPKGRYLGGDIWLDDEK